MRQVWKRSGMPVSWLTSMRTSPSTNGWQRWKHWKGDAGSSTQNSFCPSQPLTYACHQSPSYTSTRQLRLDSFNILKVLEMETELLIGGLGKAGIWRKKAGRNTYINAEQNLSSWRYLARGSFYFWQPYFADISCQKISQYSFMCETMGHTWIRFCPSKLIIAHFWSRIRFMREIIMGHTLMRVCPSSQPSLHKVSGQEINQCSFTRKITGHTWMRFCPSRRLSLTNKSVSTRNKGDSQTYYVLVLLSGHHCTFLVKRISQYSFMSEKNGT